jgi:hypothetical protein
MMTQVEMTLWALAYHDAVRDQREYWLAESKTRNVQDEYRHITTRACERAALAIEDLRRVRVEDLADVPAQNLLMEVRHR